MTDKELNYEVIEINTAEIRVPHNSYQRSLSVARARRIAANFDERIANKPKVSYRDGQFYVFDGQHTIAARRLRNNGKDLPVACKVYYGLTEQDEALLFAQQFGFSDVLTAGAKLRALIYGNDPEALAFLKATESVGLHLDYAQNLGENRMDVSVPRSGHSSELARTATRKRSRSSWKHGTESPTPCEARLSGL